MEPRLSVAVSDNLARRHSPTDPATWPPAPPRSAEYPPTRADVSRLTQFRRFLRSCGKTAATLAALAVALFGSLMIWDAYVTAPWTRDGRIRVQVASVAPQVSGQITELNV